MGLGGITRDSIADLASLIHDDDDSSNSPATSYAAPKLEECQQLRASSYSYVPSSSFDAPLSSVEDGDGTSTIGEENEAKLNDDGVSVAVGPVDLSQNAAAASALTAGESTVKNNNGMYYGFQYEGYEDYYAEDFSPYYSQENHGQDKKNVFCCLFPWLGAGEKQQSIQQDTQQQQQVQSQQTDGVAPTVQQAEGGTRATVEETTAEQLGQNLRGQTASPSLAAGGAVTAAAAATATTILSSTSSNLNNDVMASGSATKSSPKQPPKASPTKMPQESLQPSKDDKYTGVKGILKVKHCANYHNITTPKPSEKVKSASPDGKRHLFPAYEGKNNDKKVDDNRKITWIPMARVLTIPSRKDIPLSQKAQVWWQKSDYDDFKKTGRIISKAMECGGSEIWLTSTNAWGKGQQSRASASQQEAKKQNIVDKNEQLVGKESDTDSEYVKALEKYTNRSTTKSNDTSSSSDSNFGNKWWCKFGHSRRGLEHIVSSSEGKARQQSVLLAIEKILEEQKRQRVTRTKDPNKLRNVAMQYTSWARDLALAAGAADHEAVETNFDVSAKSRSHHFAEKSKHLLNNNLVAGGGVAMAITSQILDENTHSRAQMGRSGSMIKKSDGHKEHTEPDSSLSKRAKGFIPGENSDVPASQIMSGMGAGNTMTPRAALKA
ncbi:hypothetical protein ACHAXN_008686 [Cyclotella atomus]